MLHKLYDLDYHPARVATVSHPQFPQWTPSARESPQCFTTAAETSVPLAGRHRCGMDPDAMANVAYDTRAESYAARCKASFVRYGVYEVDLGLPCGRNKANIVIAASA